MLFIKQKFQEARSRTPLDFAPVTQQRQGQQEYYLNKKYIIIKCFPLELGTEKHKHHALQSSSKLEATKELSL